MANEGAAAVDLQHLDRYTGGDRAINEEVLRLFEGSCYELVQRLETAVVDAAATADPKTWREVTHTLKGAARGVGAFSLADATAAAEKVTLSDRMAVIAAVQRVKLKAEAVHIFIQDFLVGRV